MRCLRKSVEGSSACVHGFPGGFPSARPSDGQFVRPPDDQRPAREGTHIPVILLVRREARVLEPDLAWKKIAFSALDSLAYGFRDLSAVPREGGDSPPFVKGHK